MSKKTTLMIVVLTVAVTLGVSISVQSLIAAWTSPTSGAPAGNVAAPLTVGSTAQTKAGDLTINGKTTAFGGLVIHVGTPSSPVNGQMWLQ